VAEPKKNILQSYLRRLTNLSGNNRSLLLLRLYAEQLIDLHEVNGLLNLPSFEVIKALMSGRNIKLCQVLDSRLETSNETSRKLKKLQRADDFIFEERGSNDLHVGWPFVRGKFSDGTSVRCPLLFFPVSIVQENNFWYLHVRSQAGITLNKSFLMAYAFYNKIKLDEELIDASFEDFNQDSTVFRTELYQLLKEKLEINFNPDNFQDNLVPFKIFKKEEFDQQHRNGELKLFPEAVLGIFPQAGSQLVPDYLNLLENNQANDLEDFFINKNQQENSSTLSGNNYVNQVVKEEKLYTPFPLDAYQENAIKAIKNGQSIVVQGPPGTGKSQLICNLMADAIASGKRVLLVCQKRAALDVVYNRLTSRDLGEFVGLVHDFRNERRTIFSKIAKQIDNVEDYKGLNRGIDVIQTERRFFQVCRGIDQITEELEQFKQMLFDDKESGLSVKELYLTSNPQGDTINIRQEYQFLKLTELPDFLRKLRQYAGYANIFEAEDYLWRERKTFSGYALPDLKEIEKTISDVQIFQRSLEEKINSLIGVKLNLEDLESLRTREEDINAMFALIKNETIYKYFLSMIDEMDEETSLLWFSNVERVAMNCFIDEGPEKTLASDQLVKFQEALQKRMDTHNNFFRLIRWKLFSKDKVWLNQVLRANELPNNKKGLQRLEYKIDNRLNLEHHFTSIRNKPWLIDMPLDYDQSKLKTWFTRQKLAIRAKLIFNSVREVRKAVNASKYSRTEFITLFTELIAIANTLPARKTEWLKYLSPYQLRSLINDPALEKEYIKTLRKDFDSLCAFDQLKESLAAYEKNIITRLVDSSGGWDLEAHEPLLQNSLRLAWIEHIEAKYPILRSVSSRKMEEQRKELFKLVEEKQKLSHDILLQRARERVYEGVEYNRLNNRVTYRDLYHQVTKKKKIWPLRKVITDFKEELFRVMPCWMASPESVSAIFPMETMFDLVIFDEASQCFAERGIPAMYRGKQLLVAGDNMQLKPSELYQVRWEEDADHPDLEVDSLLNLSERYLPTVHLQGHYRSQSLELIDFSNRHFYEGRLQLLPDRSILNRHEPAIQYCHVNGVWGNQTNIVEAKEVTERVIKLLEQTPEKEIGIVTFNASQQELILDMLEEAFAKSGTTFPSSLFVKNIENVQGDEKDIIIFSVGYAPDKNKKMSMQFGSLSMPGGENRLNVAVTRARESIILVCSIWPEELRTDDLKNEGPKMLKEYLAFAREVDQRRYVPQVHTNIKQQPSWYLNTQIKKWGENKFQNLAFEINSMPYADLHFRSNGHYQGIVLTDDIHYFSSLSVKDSFAYTPSLLNKKNWDFHYVFSRNFWSDKERVEDDLLKFIGMRMEPVAR
jgi:hypothetical protein